jgi:uncharacterized repeat protein (TIGR01451 family)
VGWTYLLVAVFLPSFLTFQALPAVANETVIIPNKSFANFRSDPKNLASQTSSNQTTFTAIVGNAGLELTKTGDRAAAEPGDTVLYRLLIKNTGTATINNLVVQDTLPLGLRLVPSSVQGFLVTGTTTTPVSLSPATVSNRDITFRFPGSFASQQLLTLVYAAVVTPDALRGTGRNLAVAIGRTPGREIRSNPSSHLLRIRSGILSDCGTLIGRVFADKNFDGEQQPGEPGIPNAVVFMDDGNRITTDTNGLFSLANVISGYRTGVLDLSSVPGYDLAPNRYRLESNSRSRLVRLEPGGLARMNFAVAPTSEKRQR